MTETKYDYKVVIIKEGAIGTLLLGASGISASRLEKELNIYAEDGWELVFQTIELRRFLLFWQREAVLITLKRPKCST